MIIPNSIINKKIIKLYIELVNYTEKSNLSNASFEIILELEGISKNNLVRFIADLDKVEIQQTAFLKGENIYNSLEEVLNDDKDNTIFKIVDLSDDLDFHLFINQYVKNIEVEKYADGELIGFRISLSNNSSFEIYPNGYMTSGHFYDVQHYFPEKIKYVAGDTFWHKL